MAFTARHFLSHEFDSPDAPGSGENMNPKLVSLLDHIRDVYGSPISITSGFRTAEHNAAIGGVPNSAHLRGLAADISARDSATRFRIVNIALALGVTRFEIAPLHVHIDIDPTLPQNVMVHLAKY